MPGAVPRQDRLSERSRSACASSWPRRTKARRAPAVRFHTLVPLAERVCCECRHSEDGASPRFRSSDSATGCTGRAGAASVRRLQLGALLEGRMSARGNASVRERLGLRGRDCFYSLTNPSLPVETNVVYSPAADRSASIRRSAWPRWPCSTGPASARSSPHIHLLRVSVSRKRGERTGRR